MGDIANDSYFQLLQRVPNVQYRTRIQQRLRWMFVCAITSVDDWCLQIARQKMWSARCRMPHYNRIRAHRNQRVQRVYQRLTFRYAGA